MTATICLLLLWKLVVTFVCDTVLAMTYITVASTLVTFLPQTDLATCVYYERDNNDRDAHIHLEII